MGCACSRRAHRAPLEPKKSGAPRPAEQPADEEDQAALEAGKSGAGAGKVSIGGTTAADDDPSPTPPGLNAANVHVASAPILHDTAGMSPVGDVPPRRMRPARTVPSSLFAGVNHNGFKTIPELLAMTCKEENVAPHSLPVQALTYEPLPDNLVCKFKNGDTERKIHNNIKLNGSELEHLHQLRSEARAQGVEFFPSVTAMATRYLSRARGDAKKALSFMKETQKWRAEYFKKGPISDDSVAEDMKHGIVYFSGRDYAMRPVIIVRADRIPQQWYKDRDIDRFIRMLIFCMEYFLRYMVVPGKVENLSVIVDLNSLGISQVPLGPLGEVYKVMSHHYIGRVFKFYVVNMSTGLSMIAGMAKAILTDRQKQKLNLLDKVAELRKEFALTQLEEDFGGQRPAVKQFFPFQFNPGPFEAGYSGAPDGSAFPNAHEALTHAGAMGRLWDPKQSAFDNTKLEFTPSALGILKESNLQVPDDLRQCAEAAADDLVKNGAAEAEQPPRAEEEAEAKPEVDGEAPLKVARFERAEPPLVENAATSNMMAEDGDQKPFGVLPEHAKQPDVQEAAVCGGGGLFCCSK